MNNEFDVIVIGQGALGSAASYWLSCREGVSVLGLEQFSLGHDRGASHDHTRIIRLSYHSPEYVRLAQQAYLAWAMVADEANEQLVVQTGGIDLEPPGSAQPLDDYISSLAACNVPYEVLDAREILRRWPQFSLQDGTRALYQESSGFCAAIKCNTAHIKLAQAHGASILDNTAVSSIRDTRGEVEVIAGGKSYRCGKLIIAADAWTNDLLAHLGMEIPLTITQEQVTYFQTARLTDYSSDRFPVWIWMDEPSFYGFPVFGEAAVKVAQDMGGQMVTAQTRSFTADPDTLKRVQRFTATHLPGAIGPALYTKTCLYTMPPDRDFVIDTLVGHPNIIVLQGAAHSFKFASLIGKISAELAIDGTSRCDISAFRSDRSALVNHDRNAPLAYLR